MAIFQVVKENKQFEICKIVTKRTMTELKELAEVFFFSLPSHLPHIERACSFLLHPYPDPRELFAALFTKEDE